MHMATLLGLLYSHRIGDLKTDFDLAVHTINTSKMAVSTIILALVVVCYKELVCTLVQYGSLPAQWLKTR